MTEDDIFLNAVEISDAAERIRYVNEICADDEERKGRVLSLLRAHDDASKFLATPAMEDLRGKVHQLRESSSGDSVDVDSSAVTHETNDQEATPVVGHGKEMADSKVEESEIDLRFRDLLSPSTRPNWLGRLEHYEIEEILGQGAFGIVAKAFDEKLHRVVAIKMLRPELASTSPPRKRFLREARTAAALTHENIVGIYAVEEEPVPYIVMEFVPGQTLQERLNQKGPLEIVELLRIALQIARGLAAAHKAKLIHRDIKPANILLTCDPVDRIRISDFGLARAVDDASLTSSGVIAGTPLYMAPEQARGETLDSRADLFSLGSVMYQMVCGRPPFRASTTMAVLKRVCEDTPRPIKDLIPEAPEWLCAIIGRLLEKDRNDRFQTAEEVVEILERCQRELPTAGVVSFPVRRNADRRATSTKRGVESGKRTTRWLIPILLSVAVIPILYMIKVNLGSRSATKNGIAELATGSAVPENRADADPQPGWHGWPADAPRPAIAPFDAVQARRHQEEWAKYLNVDLEYTNSIGMKFMLIPPGEFTMGSTPEEVEEMLKHLGQPRYGEEGMKSQTPQHMVVLTQPVYMGSHEVTQGQYEQVMGQNPAHFSATGGGRVQVARVDTSKLPVETVTWNDAADFCVNLSRLENLTPRYARIDGVNHSKHGSGYRLPTEAEWEYACRAGTTSKYSFGEGNTGLLEHGWFDATSEQRTHPVGELKPNPYGLYDTHGNLLEWVQDAWQPEYYEAFRQGPGVDPIGGNPAGERRVIRGSGFHHHYSRCGSANRLPDGLLGKNQFMGFRISIPIRPGNELTSNRSPEVDLEQTGKSLLWTNGRVTDREIRTIANSTPESYRLEFSARGTDSKMFMVVFPIADRQACLTFGGFRKLGAPLYGLERIDGKGLFDIFPNAVGDFFADNQSHRISLTVTPTSVSATLDGTAIVNWNGDASRLDVYEWLRLHLYGPLFINAVAGEWEITDITIESLADPTQALLSDREIIDFVRSTGGRLTLGEPPLSGTSLTAIENPRPLSSDVVHFDFRRSKLNLDKQFGDEQLTRFAQLMKLRPDIKIGVLNLVGTTVSNTGLLTLQQVPITELMIYNTRVNGNQIAEQLATFPISDWDFGSSVSSDSLAVLAKNPNLRGISLDSTTVDAQSLSVFANSKLRRLQLFGRENPSLPTVDQLSGLAELTDLYLPNYELESDASMLRSLQESLPGVKIHTKSYADRLPLPSEYPENDLDIILLVESVGGEVHQYRPEGLVRVSTANNLTLSRSMGAINIAAYSKPEFDDSKLLELTALLKQRPDIDLICLHFPGTSISNVGLRSLKGFRISQLFCNHTMVNGDEVANEAPEFKVREWGHVPKLTERGFSKFLESPHVIAIDIPAGDVTPTVIRNAAESNLRHFGMIDMKASDLPPVQSFSVLTEIQVLALQSTDKIPQEYLEDLHVQVPQAEIRCGLRTIPPDDAAIQARLFAGRKISNGVPVAIAQDVPHSYLLEIKARRITGEDAIGIRFPIADSAAMILFSAFTDHTGGLSGLALIDGVDLPKSPHTKQGNPFADGKDHVIRIVVTPRTVTATIDDEEYVRWEGDPARLKPYAYLEGHKAPLFIRTWADFYVSELKLEAIDSAELTEPSEEKPIDAN